jgi:hypothetical protein
MNTQVAPIVENIPYKKLLEKYTPKNGIVDINFSVLEKYLLLAQNEKPKKVPSAFLLFLNDKRSEILDSINEDRESELTGKEKTTEVSKKAGLIWKEMNDEEKQPYTIKVDKLKENYSEMIDIWNTINRNIQSDVAPVNIPTNEPQNVVVSKFNYNNKTYLINKENGDVYDSETSEIIGSKNGNIIIFNDA